MESLFNSLKLFFNQYGFSRTYWIAYSGGLDSHVLLHLCAILRAEFPLSLKAIYINHGLSKHAAEWGAHCANVCCDLQIDFNEHIVNAAPQPNESPEDVARKARYQKLAELLATDDFLLTAHHQDDQAETVLLQLLRGAGPKGLASMPQLKKISNQSNTYFHARPLLAFSRKNLEEYAKTHNLQWIEDESNTNTQFNRNFLRQEVIPLLKKRWPSVNKTLSRVAEHCAETITLLNQYTKAQQAIDNTLCVKTLSQLTPEQQRSELREWIARLGFPLPNAVKLKQIQQDFLTAREDKLPHIQWQFVEMRRYQHKLFLMPCLKPHDIKQVFHWDASKPLIMPNVGKVSLLNGVSEIEPMTVRFRQGGEVCQLSRRHHRHELKKLFQEWNVPPWQRDRIPLVFIKDRLVAVLGYFLDDLYGHLMFQFDPESLAY